MSALMKLACSRLVMPLFQAGVPRPPLWNVFLTTMSPLVSRVTLTIAT